MTSFARTDRSVLGRWWWTIDRWTLAALDYAIALGRGVDHGCQPAGRGPHRRGRISFRSQALCFSGACDCGDACHVVTWVHRGVRRVAVLILIISIGLLVVTPLVGSEIKGARRWISFGRLFASGVGICEAGFGGCGCLALCRGKTQPGFPGLLGVGHSGRHCCRPADLAARLRDGGNGCHHMGRPAFPGRSAPHFCSGAW